MKIQCVFKRDSLQLICGGYLLDSILSVQG